MHRTSEGLYVVDTLTEFNIPNTKDQLYILKKVIEKVYLFKVYILIAFSLDAFCFLHIHASTLFLV